MASEKEEEEFIEVDTCELQGIERRLRIIPFATTVRHVFVTGGTIEQLVPGQGWRNIRELQPVDLHVPLPFYYIHRPIVSMHEFQQRVFTHNLMATLVESMWVSVNGMVTDGYRVCKKCGDTYRCCPGDEDVISMWCMLSGPSKMKKADPTLCSACDRQRTMKLL